MSDTLAPKAERRLSGKVALITRAATGIGLALALRAADQGMKVVLADHDERLLRAALDQVTAKGVAASAVHTNGSDFAAICELAQRAEDGHGLPWLVCNILATSIDLYLLVNSVQVFAPSMVKRGCGHIVNIVSPEFLGTCGTAAYLATTHAIEGLSESLYRELDSMGSQVGVTFAYPRLADTSVARATEYHRPAGSLVHAIPQGVLSPRDLAEQIFAAVFTGSFWVYLDAPRGHETSGLGCATGGDADLRHQCRPIFGDKTEDHRVGTQVDRPVEPLYGHAAEQGRAGVVNIDGGMTQ